MNANMKSTDHQSKAGIPYNFYRRKAVGHIQNAPAVETEGLIRAMSGKPTKEIVPGIDEQQLAGDHSGTGYPTLLFPRWNGFSAIMKIRKIPTKLL